MAVYARGLDLVREVRKGTLSPSNGLGMTKRGGDRARRGQSKEGTVSWQKESSAKGFWQKQTLSE